jgi:hypothetical protein
VRPSPVVVLALLDALLALALHFGEAHGQPFFK